MTNIHGSQGLDKYAFAHVSQRPDEIHRFLHSRPDSCTQRAPSDSNRPRLDLIHDALTAYFDGRLTPVPLESDPPKSILEMGAGSGAWTEQAAETFPQAEVVAVDLAEIPRALPANVTFHIADLTKPFNFTSDRFDIVHARLLFVNLPDFQSVFTRTFDLVNPGGWFIIEDVVLATYEEEATDGPNPIIIKWNNAWKEAMEARNADNMATTKYESLLRDSGAFSEVNVRKIEVPVSGQTEDPILRQLGVAMRHTINTIFPQLPERLSDPRLTESMAQEMLAVINDESRKLSVHFFVLWARKSV